jgi:hypothetical protein
MPIFKFTITDKLIAKSRRLINKEKRNKPLGYFPYGTICPIALAIKEVFGKKFAVEVDAAAVQIATTLDYVSDEFDYKEITLTRAVRKFIEDFDNGAKVSGLEFTLNIPKKYIPKGYVAV